MPTQKRRLMSGGRFNYDPSAFQRQPLIPADDPGMAQHQALIQAPTVQQVRQQPLNADGIQKLVKMLPKPAMGNDLPEQGGITGNLPYSPYEPDVSKSPVSAPSNPGRLLSGDSGAVGLPSPTSADGYAPLISAINQLPATAPGPTFSQNDQPTGNDLQQAYQENGGTPYSYAGPAADVPKKKLLSGSGIEPSMQPSNLRTTADYEQALNQNAEKQYENSHWKGLGLEQPPREKNFAKRLLGGIVDGLHEWQSEGGPGGGEGLISSIVTGGAGSAASPRYAQEQKLLADKRQLLGGYGLAQKEEAFQTKQDKVQADIDNANNQVTNRNKDEQRKEIVDQQNSIRQRWAALKSYKRGDDPKFDAEADAAHLNLPEKKPEDQWEIAPSGQMYNRRTGEVVKGSNFSKPPTISASELPDSLVGLEDDSSIATRAKAAVGKGPEGSQLRPDAATRAGSYFHDGQFDESKYWSDRAMGMTDVTPSDIYQNVPSDYEQRLAAKTNEFRNSQKPLREEWAKFKLAVTNQRTPENAEYKATPVQMVGLFKDVMSIKDQKKRQAKLNDLYDTLSKTRLN